MLPKWHILFGAIFSLVLFFVFNISLFYSITFFLVSVFIDIDHYLFFVYRNKDWSLKNAYKWHIKLGRKHKPIMHILHSIEFLILIFLLSFLHKIFLFIFIGLIFHSICDILDMIYLNKLGVREFSLIRYLLSDKKKYF